MAVKREHAGILAGLVDTVVNAAADVVDDARDTIDKLDNIVREGAVVLTRLADTLESLIDETDGETIKDTDNSEAMSNVINALAEHFKFNRSFLETLNYDRIRNLYNTVSNEGTVWSDATDKPNATTPVEEPVKEYIPYYSKINYIASRTTLTFDEMLGFEPDSISRMYDSLKARENAADQDQAWRNF